tara:strand:+ start:4926 stop:5111 length:186 start_codon:yes stop_codon:yes gene_type:complete
MIHLDRYKQNLHIKDNNVYSYNTNVATIVNDKLIVLGWWSVTTSKHINYVARELDLDIVRS